MKKAKNFLVCSIIVSSAAILLFIFNQLCNLRFWGLWAAWNLSGYAYVLLATPASIIVSVFAIEAAFKEIKKYKILFVVNLILTLIVLSLQISCFLPCLEVLTWK